MLQTLQCYGDKLQCYGDKQFGKKQFCSRKLSIQKSSFPENWRDIRGKNESESALRIVVVLKANLVNTG